MAVNEGWMVKAIMCIGYRLDIAEKMGGLEGSYVK